MGTYEMGIGSSSSLESPPIVCRTFTSGIFEYEMEDMTGWHYVRPIDEPSLSIMVTGVPWERNVIKNIEPLAPLSPDKREELFTLFSQWYS
jgi:hypothetical protein